MTPKLRRFFPSCSIIAICAIFFFSSGVPADTYKWVDEKGVTHFSDSQPPDKEAEQIQEHPVQKIGDEKTTSPKANENHSRDNSRSQNIYLEERIAYYERQVNDRENEISSLKQKIEDLERKIWNIPSYSHSSAQAEHHDNLKKGYQTDIDNYKSMIKEKQNQISEYKDRIDELRRELK
jgi:predicted RNase H-like nuclease (RuvC/YqgF family)